MGRSKVVQFYATRRDLDPGLRSIERKQRLKVIEHRYFESKSVPVLESLLSIPKLGEVFQRYSSPWYLVLPATERIKVRRVVQIGRPGDIPGRISRLLKFVRINPRNAMVWLAFIGIRPPGGRVVYEVCHVDHPSSIKFAPGGLWDARTLVGGEIGTMHHTAASLEMFRLFCKELLQGFVEVRSFYVGPEALALLKSGARLTIDVKASPLWDLVLD